LNELVAVLRLARRVVAAMADRVAVSVFLWDKAPGNRYLTFFPLALMPPLADAEAMGSRERGQRIWNRVVDPVRGSPALTLGFYGGLIAMPAWSSRGDGVEIANTRHTPSEWQQLGVLLAALDCEWLAAHGQCDPAASARVLGWLDALLARVGDGDVRMRFEESGQPRDLTWAEVTGRDGASERIAWAADEVDGSFGKAEDSTRIRVLAVDWSGKEIGARKTIWLAEAGPDGLVQLSAGRTRDEIAAYLEAERTTGLPMVVGLDFAFSLPAWFLEARGLQTAPSLWTWLASDGNAEKLIRSCEPPFWGRPGKRRPDAHTGARLRRTEDALRAAGIPPKSVFQIGGAGSVGTGSLRGMPFLLRLHEAGFAVWPFTAPGEHTLIEIYPRLLTGRVNKSSPDERARALASYPEIRGDLRILAAASEDAFDAAVSAVVMWRRRAELTTLMPAEGAFTRLEGQIWGGR
jgi:hypothetical protein